MQQNVLKCSNRVGGRLECPLCKGMCVKHGKTTADKQRYQCKICKKTFIENYTSLAYLIPSGSITALLKESCGIRSIARLLKISCSTVIKRVLAAKKMIVKPTIFFNKEYEIDEMRTYYRNKNRLLWIVYALERNTKTVIDFAVGSRTLKTLKKVTDTVLLSVASRVYTDKLNLYSTLLPSSIHCTKVYSINHIERKNLTLRTHLKRLNRRTICFSKSIAMLEACLQIYFWG